MVNNIEFGISIYLSTNIEMNSEYLLKAKEVNSSFVFTTINMPEENDELKKDISKVVDPVSYTHLTLPTTPYV